ncbi:hypothetical protein [Candidatus Bacteroides intestinigallinarum]|uniref:hypothetical protein n=1 Tax=Candidatus Bacteroides intestinigallinarum TaxID=2838470 RepID=UPI0021656B4E|nr:hypothetical protein [Candidatus Bacteroides intestinigallinarum]MCS3201222.1 hypothetical protein [Candidatus Bacteroides intestinigallinarum]
MDKELLLKYIAGKASQKEKEDVATWIDADAANLKEFISLRKSYDAFIWQDTGAFSKKTKRQFHCILLHNESYGLRQCLL